MVKGVSSASDVVAIIEEAIEQWHKTHEGDAARRVIVTDEVRRIRPLGVHREDFCDVIRELALTNTEIWHEEDKVRSKDDAVVLKAIRNINPLNQHRNDLIEEADEIALEFFGEAGKEG